jgi:hypothetical protein
MVRLHWGGIPLKPLSICAVLSKMNREKTSNISDNPSYWLGRAKELREMLKSVSDEEMREHAEEIAEGYGHIAKLIARKQNSEIKQC